MASFSVSCEALITAFFCAETLILDSFSPLLPEDCPSSFKPYPSPAVFPTGFSLLSSIATMPSKKQPSSMTYPSAPGSDVYRSASFWSLPSLASTPACSEHSVQTQRSKDNQGRLEILLDYPAHSKNTRVLEEADIWRAEKLRVKLSAMAEACREWEQALAKSALVSGYVRPTSLLSRPLTRIRCRRVTLHPRP